jgi:AcrR family transcriptional regulator
MSSPPASNPSRPGPRPRFTREQVFETALRLIDSEPPEAFTMRRVAEEMGMGVMTLYGYVKSKEEILEGVTHLIVAEVHRDVRPDAGWDDRLRADALLLHSICRRHPNLPAHIIGTTSTSPGLFRLRERMLDTLLNAGFEHVTALHALGVLIGYVLGFTGAQASAAPGALRERLSDLPAADFPRLHQVAAVYPAHLSDEAFDYGLELILHGLRAGLEP